MYLKLLETKDIPRFVDLCYNFHQASPYKDRSFSVEKVTALAKSITTSNKKDFIIITLVDDNHVTQGFLVGLTSEIPFSEERAAMELAWWVEPEARGTRKSVEMVMAFKDWAKRVGCKVAQMSMIENTGTDKIDRLYTKAGLQRAEVNYIGEL